MKYSEPIPFDLNQKRYFPRKLFPSYRHILGVTPNPVNNPLGHSYKLSIIETPIINKNNWKTNSTYLYAIDLFNFAYWWECHEYLFNGHKNYINNDRSHHLLN